MIDILKVRSINVLVVLCSAYRIKACECSMASLNQFLYLARVPIFDFSVQSCIGGGGCIHRPCSHSNIGSSILVSRDILC